MDLKINKEYKTLMEEGRASEVKRLLEKEVSEKLKEIDRQARIAKKLFDIISIAIMNHDYIKDEYVDIYIQNIHESVGETIQSIDDEIALLLKLKGMFEKRNMIRSIK